MLSRGGFRRPWISRVCCLVLMKLTCDCHTVGFVLRRQHRDRWQSLQRGWESLQRETIRQRLMLQMSDFPDQEKDLIGFGLPPNPEDKVVLTGDLLCLAVYGFFDHFICYDIAHFMMRNLDSPHKLFEAAASAPSSGGVLPAANWGAPVWLEHGNHYTLHVLQVTLQDRLVTSYSPVLEPVGLATCLLSTCWLLSGWWHRAFLFPNTVACTTTRAITITAQTWFTCTLIMLSVVSLTHGIDNNSFTKGDLDFIFDSLTVLIAWRFTASYFFGTGPDSD